MNRIEIEPQKLFAQLLLDAQRCTNAQHRLHLGFTLFSAPFRVEAAGFHQFIDARAYALPERFAEMPGQPEIRIEHDSFRIDDVYGFRVGFEERAHQAKRGMAVDMGALLHSISDSLYLF